MSLKLLQNRLARWMDFFVGAKKKGAEESEMERRIRAALRERVSRGKKRKIHLNTIALKFPKADQAFQQIRKQFDTYDKDHSQSIDLEELRECFRELKVVLSEGELEQLFEEADMDSQEGVQFKEFILLMALVYLLKPVPSGTRFGLPEVEAAFEMVEDAFIFFDEDGDGYLTQEEISHALKSGREGMAGSAAAQRFAEMDFNTDGQCSFKEFLYAYVGWVGTAEEDQDEEESSLPS